MRIFLLFIPVFVLASPLPILNISDDVVLSYFFTMWIYFLVILFPIVAVMALFRF